MERTELKEHDKFSFSEEGGVRTYKVGDIAIKDFSNKIWRSGFIHGMMTGGALILLVIAVIIGFR